jgi:branched-chain amino acid transport system ATP-binding protein
VSATPALTVRSVDVVFDGVIQVLRALSLEVRQRQIVALLGGNGAGKTTTLKTISSLVEVEHGRVEAGEVLFDGADITNADPCDVVRSGIVQVLEGRRVLKHLTVEQNLRLGAHFRRDRTAIRADADSVYAMFPRLTELRSRTAGYLSGGEMQMLLLGRALMARPKLLLLDEPSMGLAPMLVRELFDRVLQVREAQGIAVLVVEQNARAALRIADYGYVIENGRIVLHGTRADLEQNEDVREFYLGLSTGSERRRFRDVKHYKRRKRWLG